MTTARRHDIDALRVLAFGSLILYHLAMFYVAEWGWHIKSVHLADWLQLPMIALNRWRMELLFLISGVALNLLLRHRAGGWRLAGQRSWRLLLPLAFGMAVVVPIQPYAEALGKGAIQPGFADFLLRYWSGRGFPPDSFGGWEHGWTWNHLWYLAYLWIYTLLLMALRPALDARWSRRLLTLRAGALLTLPAIPFVLLAWWLQGRFPSTNDLVSDWFMHGIYFTAFLYGYWLGTDAGLWKELARLRWRSLGWALALLLPYLTVLELLEDDSPHWQIQCARLLRWSYMWLALCSVLGWAHQHLNRPYRWLPYATEAVYPWYVLHQSLIVALGFGLAPLALGPVAEPVLILLGTVGGCVLLHRGLIRRSGLLRPLFGLPRPMRAGSVAAVGKFAPATV